VGVAEQTDFIYDGQDIVLALDGEGSLTNRYLHGPAIDQILADEQIAEEQMLWTLADNLGSVRDLVNNAGEVESHIDYMAFGAVETITNNLVQTLYGFTGRERDAETGQTYHRARYYDPLVGRWLSEDPIGFNAGDGNIQRYVGNDPVNYTDPSGLAEEPAYGTREWFHWWEGQDYHNPHKVGSKKWSEREERKSRAADQLYEEVVARAEQDYSHLPQDDARRNALRDIRNEHRAAAARNGTASAPADSSAGMTAASKEFDNNMIANARSATYRFFARIFTPATVNPTATSMDNVVTAAGGLAPASAVGQAANPTPATPNASTGNTSTNSLTPRAARRQAMREAGIPTSQQPDAQRSVKSQSGQPAGRQYDYSTPKPGGGTQKHSVQHSLTDQAHGPHWEAGPIKQGGQTDSLGRPRLQEGRKTKVNE
jgi:RHS repeat-associated protein